MAVVRARGNRLRRIPLAALMLAVLVAPAPGMRQDDVDAPARSLDDARLRRLREVSASWELRAGPRREVLQEVPLDVRPAPQQPEPDVAVGDLAGLVEEVARQRDAKGLHGEGPSVIACPA